MSGSVLGQFPQLLLGPTMAHNGGGQLEAATSPSSPHLALSLGMQSAACWCGMGDASPALRPSPSPPPDKKLIQQWWEHSPCQPNPMTLTCHD